MNLETKVFINNAKKREFNVKETLLLLNSGKMVYWSWGVSKAYNVDNKALVLKVNGHHHKGYVVITLDYDDTYCVDIVSTRGNVKTTFTDIYFEDLVNVIDNRIERIAEYHF